MVFQMANNAEAGVMVEMEQGSQAGKLFREENGQCVVKTRLGDEGEESLRMSSGFLDYIIGWTAIPYSELMGRRARWRKGHELDILRCFSSTHS